MATTTATTSTTTTSTTTTTLLLLLPLLLGLHAGVADAAGGRSLLAAVGQRASSAGTNRAVSALAADDCSKYVPNCSGCRLTSTAPTAKPVCTSCDFGYLVKSSGKACWCAPGFYLSAKSTCSRCGLGFFCPGAKTTEASGAARTSCGLNRNTSSATSTSERDCLVNPGFAWGPGDSSAPCPAGTYNPGGNTRTKCSPCLGGLTTYAPGATDITDCVAAPGFT